MLFLIESVSFAVGCSVNVFKLMFPLLPPVNGKRTALHGGCICHAVGEAAAGG